jgi:hypothetical protein
LSGITLCVAAESRQRLPVGFLSNVSALLSVSLENEKFVDSLLLSGRTTSGTNNDYHADNKWTGIGRRFHIVNGFWQIRAGTGQERGGHIVPTKFF